MIIWSVIKVFEMLYGVTIDGNVLPPILAFGFLELLIEITIMVLVLFVPFIVLANGGKDD